ncbi:MAG: DUF362 domain-containing protein, partial [bacterium]|nr:DUF362 domain-containing protein [bacterium]
MIKPNVIGLRPRRSYRTGDITDMRVTQAVMEYVAVKSRASRVTLAEGGSYRNFGDKGKDNVVFQNGHQVNAETFDWGSDEWQGFNGSLGDMLARLRRLAPNKEFNYTDLAYDAVRDAGGRLQTVMVPAGPNGVGAASTKPDYFVANTIVDCDFLITVPVLKVHNQCGITCCLKNYVGTAPRIAYASPGGFSNRRLHDQYSVDGRIDPFIADLAAFHPPDYAVVDGILGLQRTEHGNRRPDQQVRSNLIIAGEDPVAADALGAQLTGFNPWDIDYLHHGQSYGMGTFDLSKMDVRGDEPDHLRRLWQKPRRWYGRANREWLISSDPDAPLRSWEPHTSSMDTLEVPGLNEGATASAAVRVMAEGRRKAFLWAGCRGGLTARLNGEVVMERTNRARYRKGHFRQAVELRPGENLLEFRL